MATIAVLLPFTTETTLLQLAIESILQQTYRDFKLLLIDNAGNADSLTLVNKFVEVDSRCLLLHEDRPGIAFALNRGLEECVGPFVARMDADDIAMPERLLKQLEYLQQHSEVGAVSCQTSVYPVNESNTGIIEFVQWQNNILSAEDHYLNRFIESPVAHPTLLMRRSLFNAYGHYSTDPIPEDYELWLRWMKQDVAIAKLPEILLHWRDSTDRLTRTHHHYQEDRFFEAKTAYLLDWMSKHVPENHRIVVCGGSKNIREKAHRLAKAGLKISLITDVTNRNTSPWDFIPADRLYNDGQTFVLNLISKRDAREPIRSFLKAIGFVEGISFIMAG